MYLSNIYKEYEKDKYLLGYSPITLKAYKLQHNLLLRYFGNIKLNDITYQNIKDYLYHQIHLKPASIGRRIRFIRSLFRWAHDEGYIDRNPASKLQEPKRGKRIPKSLNDEEIETLRVYCVSALENMIVELLFTTGCRIGEIVKLNKSDINWEHKTIVVNGKGDKEREVYFTIRCEIWLKRYLKERKDNDDALIVTERKPHRMSIAQIRYILKRIAKRSGLETNVYPHRMRHSFAMHLLNNHAPMEVIKELLGHQKLETTYLYAQLSGEHRREMYKKYF